jgi:hypothetical protein
MIAKLIMGLSMCVSFTTLALGANWIQEWGGAPNIQYRVVQEEHTILLQSPGTFKFWAYDPEDPNWPPGHIESITVAPGVTGVINLYIAHPDGPEFWGAQDVDVVDLSGQAETNICELRTYGNLAADGDVRATRLTGPCHVRRNILHDIHLASLYGELRCRTMQNLTVTDPAPGPAGTRIIIGVVPPGEPEAEDYAGTIDVAGTIEYLWVNTRLDGTVRSGADLVECVCAGVRGNVSVGRDLYSFSTGDDVSGTITVGAGETGDLRGHFSALGSACLTGQLIINGDLHWDGWIHVARDISGLIHVLHDVHGFISTEGFFPGVAGISGVIQIDGDLGGIIWTLCSGVTGRIDVGGSIAYGGEIRVGSTGTPECEHDLTGSVTVAGDMLGGSRIWISGTLRDPSDPNNPPPELLGGYIIVNGSFGEEFAQALIHMNGNLEGPRSFIAVDYDGYEPDDRWIRGYGCIERPDVGSASYLTCQPEWQERLFETTLCRGDMNNDGAVDYGDINPFVMGLSNPAAFTVAYPGCGGSRVYHGDCNCDGLFDYGDINPFVLRLIEGCCWEECGPCPGVEPTVLPEPDVLAALLAQHVEPEHYDYLVEMAAGAASVQTDPELKAYWEAVHGALAP